MSVVLTPTTLEEMVEACELSDASIDPDNPDAPRVDVLPTNAFMSHLCQRIIALEGP